MLERGSGKIIFTASLLSFQGGINVPDYPAAKSGIAGLTKALSNEWAALRHINAAVLARRGTVPALFSVGLRDGISPPATVFSAYHAWNGPKHIEEYPYNGHEGGGAVQLAVQLDWLGRHS